MAADVKWIKIVVDIFDDEKILLIEAMPEADSLITIWFKLLCLAGKQNNSGVFMLNDRIAYTDEMFATIFRRKLNTVRMALKTFEELQMIEIINGAVTIPNWGKHQSLEQIEARREYMRQYMRQYYQKQKALAEGAQDSKRLDKCLDKQILSSAEIDLEQELKQEPEQDIFNTEPVDGGDALVRYAAINLQYISMNNIDELTSYRDSLPDEVITWAIDEACAHGSRKYAYARTILNRLVESGVKTLGDAKAQQEAWQKARGTNMTQRAAKRGMEREGMEDDWGNISSLMNRPIGTMN